MYPHTAACYWWDRRDRLVCTPWCRHYHPRTWLIRRGHECLYLGDTKIIRPFWRIFRHNGTTGYVAVAGADSFSWILTMVNKPQPVLETAAQYVSA